MTYTGPLIDAHHHFWDLNMGKHPWLVPAPDQEMVFGDPAPLYRDYLPADLEADACNQNLVASVHVEAGWDRADHVADAPVEVEVNASGLPVRRPGTMLVPGGITKPASAVARDPEAIPIDGKSVRALTGGQRGGPYR